MVDTALEEEDPIIEVAVEAGVEAVKPEIILKKNLKI